MNQAALFSFTLLAADKAEEYAQQVVAEDVLEQVTKSAVEVSRVACHHPPRCILNKFLPGN